MSEWRSCASKPSSQGKYKRRNGNTKLIDQYWSGVEWCWPADMHRAAIQTGEWLDESGAAMVDADRFRAATGYEPQDDDLERCNCKQDHLGHSFCGWCGDHDKPRFMCGCSSLAAAPVDQRETDCCRCNESYPITQRICTRCGAINANVDFEGAQRQRDEPPPFKPYRDPRFGLLIKWPSVRERRVFECPVNAFFRGMK